MKTIGCEWRAPRAQARAPTHLERAFAGVDMEIRRARPRRHRAEGRRLKPEQQETCHVIVSQCHAPHAQALRMVPAARTPNFVSAARNPRRGCACPPPLPMQPSKGCAPSTTRRTTNVAGRRGASTARLGDALEVLGGHRPARGGGVSPTHLFRVARCCKTPWRPTTSPSTTCFGDTLPIRVVVSLSSCEWLRNRTFALRLTVTHTHKTHRGALGTELGSACFDTPWEAFALAKSIHKGQDHNELCFTCKRPAKLMAMQRNHLNAQPTAVGVEGPARCCCSCPCLAPIICFVDALMSCFNRNTHTPKLKALVHPKVFKWASVRSVSRVVW